MAKLKKTVTSALSAAKKKKDEDIAPVRSFSFSNAANKVISDDRIKEAVNRSREAREREQRAKEIEAELLTRPEYAQTAHDMRELDLIAKQILYATDYDVQESTEKTIAPFMNVLEGMKNTEWFSNAELFDDGYQPWKLELLGTANATMADLTEHLQQGGIDWAEGVVDAGATALGDLAGKVGWTDAQDFFMNDVVFHDVVKKPWEYAEDALGVDIPSVHEILGLSDEDIENRSILGEGLEGSAESLAQMMLNRELIEMAGRNGVKLPWQVPTGVTTFGQGVSEGLEQGLDNEQAKKLGFIKAASEIITESIFGDSIQGEKGLFDLGKLTSEITNPLLKLAADYGLTIPSNSIEEGLTETINIAGEAYVRGEDVRAALSSKESLKRIGNSMFSGAMFSAVTNAPNAVKAGVTGTDFKTGLTKNETEIVDRVTEKLVNEKESNGEKITDTKRGKIRESVIEMMDRGEISTDLIEEVFGGETYEKYYNLTKSEEAIVNKLAQQYSGDELKQKVESILSGSERSAMKDQLSNEVSKFVQNDRLSESYRQNAEGKVRFNADLSQYNDAERKIVQKAIESKVLNNKRKTHELVDFVAKVSAKLGVDFDFVNNDKLKELGFSVDGADINGYVDKNGNIVINAESSKYLNVVLGHEISHVLEGTELYEAVEKILVDFSVNKKAKSSKFKNEYQERLDRAISLYQNIEGYKGTEGFKNIEREVFADLIGDYLFTDKSFVEHLANTSHKGFQKILDSIEGLYKMATAGSKEAKALEKLKQTFMDAFAEAEKKKTTYNGGVKYSLGDIDFTRTYFDYKDTSSRRQAEDSKVNELIEKEKVTSIAAKDIPREISNVDWSNKDASRIAIRDILNEFSGKSVILNAEGNSAVAYLTARGIDHTVAGSNTDSKAIALSFYYDLIANAEYCYSTPKDPHSKTAGREDWDYFVSVAEIEGKGTLPVVFAVRSIDEDIRSQIYSIATKNNSAIPRGDGTQNKTANAHPSYGDSPSHTKTISQEKPGVKKLSLSEANSTDINDYSLKAIEDMTFEELEQEVLRLGLDDILLELDDDILLDDDFSIDDISEETSVKPEIIEILYRRSGLGKTHIADGKKAVMTESRINQRIQEHSAKFSPDYARAYITRISPKDFIDLTVTEKNMDRENFDANVRGDFDGRMGDWDYEQQLRDSEDPPRLSIDITTGKIFSHNGRHRVRALEMAGIESVEIEVEFYDEDGLVKYNAHVIPDMAISSQFDSAVETHISNIIPFNHAFKPEIEKYYGENANGDAKVKYSLSNGSENTYGDYHISGEDVSFKDIAPAKTTQETVKTEQNLPIYDNQKVITDEEEFDSLDQRRIEMEAQFEDIIANQDWEAYGKLEPEYKKVTQRLAELEAKFAEQDESRFADVEDIAPTAEQYEESSVESVTLTKKAENDIARDVRGWLGVKDPKKMATVREIIRNYAENENPNREALAEEIRNKLGTYTETTEADEMVQDAKKFLRTYPIKISDAVQSEIADYDAWKKRNRFRLKISEDGMSIDEVYQELNGMWPTLFPLDTRDGNISPTDELMRIEHVASMDKAIKETMKVDEEQIYGAADAIMQAFSDYRNAQKEKDSRPEKGYLDSLMNEAEKFVDADVTIPNETPGIAPSANSLPNITEEQAEKIAQIKRYDPKKKDGGFFARAKKIFNEFVSAVGDKAWALENLSKKTGMDKVEADYDFMAHRSQGVAQQYIKKNLIPFLQKMERIGKVANKTPVVEVTKAGNKTVTDYIEKFNYYAQHLNNMDRMSRETAEERQHRMDLRNQLSDFTEKQIENLSQERITKATSDQRAKQIYIAQEYMELGGANGKNVGVFNNDVITAEVSRQMVKIYEQAHPEFKQLVKEYQQYFKSLREEAFKAGLVSRDTIQLWDKISPNYIPVSRTDKNGNNVSVPLDSNKTGVNNPFKRAKGGNSDIEPFAETAAKYTVNLMRAIHRNNFGKTLMDAMDKSTAIDVQKSMDKETLKKIMDGALEPGTRVKAADRDNVGTIKSFDAKSGKYMVYFENKEGHSATVPLDGKILTPLNPIHERGKTDANDLLDSTEADDNKVLTPGENGKAPQFTVFVDGKPVTFDITEEIYNALKPTEGMLSRTYFTAKPLEGYKKLVTELKPTFSFFRNPWKDAKDVLYNSKHAFETYKSVPDAINQMVKDGAGWQEFMSNGGDTITYYKSDTHELDINADEKGKWKVYSKAAHKIELVFRFAEYLASRKSGRDIQQSMLDAARVTTNFQAGGDVTKWANRNFSPFLNPSVQGVMQHARNIREAYHGGPKQWAILAGKVILTGIAPVATLLNFLIWDDDEDYQALSDYIKANYFIVAKLPDGRFLRIPKGRTEAVLQYAGSMMKDLITGDDETDLETFAQLVANNIAPNNPAEDTLWAPITQAINNKTWYGEDLVPTRLAGLNPEEQFDESTDYLSRFLGETLGWSPYKINYVLDQYGGGVSDMILPFLTPQAEGENFLAPIVDEFVSDPVFKNQYVSDFYDIKDKLSANAKSAKATDDDILMNKYMSSVSDEMSDLYAEKRRIQNSDMSNSKKYKQIREIQKEIDALAEEALNSYEDITYEGNHAKIGDTYFEWYEPEKGDAYWRKLSDEQTTKYLLTKDAKGHYVTDGKVHYRLDEDGNWTKISDKQLARQKEVTKSLGITPDEYWSKTSISYMPMSNGEYEYAFENPNTYTVAKAVGGYEAYSTYSKGLSSIKADKDSNGKSISGSRKKKVVSYISSLDIDDGEKYILYKKEYPSDDSYNREIVEYLNSRDDISYREMEIILTELGFKVSADGRITW